MYQIKPKKSRYMLFLICGFLVICAIGAGIGYAAVRITGKSTKIEYDSNLIQNTPTQAPDDILIEAKEVIKTETDIKNATSAPKEEYLYLIKLENNRTKVYTLTDNSVVYSHDLPVEPGALPPGDINNLKQGIYLKNKDELLSFTEDFCS